MMPELISFSTRKARKNHKCGLCGDEIIKGELYRRQFLKYGGEVYDFKEHERCGEIATALWHYLDPADGLTEEYFEEGCQEYCCRFVCPHCEHWDKSEDAECSKGLDYCLDKILERLVEYGLKIDKQSYKWVEFKRLEGHR